jgi:hypothetical protein
MNPSNSLSSSSATQLQGQKIMSFAPTPQMMSTKKIFEANEEFKLAVQEMSKLSSVKK